MYEVSHFVVQLALHLQHKLYLQLQLTVVKGATELHFMASWHFVQRVFDLSKLIASCSLLVLACKG